MIDERGLLAAVRSAWRGGGYEVVGNGQELVLRGQGWLAVLPRGIVPWNVLALLVEHLGEIPEGAAWKVYKKQGPRPRWWTWLWRRWTPSGESWRVSRIPGRPTGRP